MAQKQNPLNRTSIPSILVTPVEATGRLPEQDANRSL